MTVEELIAAAQALSDADFGRLRRALNSLDKGNVEALVTEATALPDLDLGLLRRFANSEFENRIRHTKGLTEDEQALLSKSKLDCVRAVRERTGLGLADSKELVDRWERGER